MITKKAQIEKVRQKAASLLSELGYGEMTLLEITKGEDSYPSLAVIALSCFTEEVKDSKATVLPGQVEYRIMPEFLNKTINSIKGELDGYRQ